ncbi:MAG TPA: hypothetical protein VFU32_11530 [Ktedonobacterales bacterium]|nr:hypothetical protein [Ktedonobacterales bacterium]
MALKKQARRGLFDAAPRKLTREGIIVEQHIREGRFQRSLALIAGLSSVLSGWEVATEHYRGSYNQRLMYTPLILSPALLIAGMWGATSRKAARTVLPIVSAVTMIDGLIGFIWHIRGVARKPGGWRIPTFTVVMGPPVLAPLLFMISGYLGVMASLLRREDDPKHILLPGIPRPPRVWRHLLPRKISKEGIRLEHEIREGRFQRHLAGVMALSAFCSGFEALYSHYKNNFTYKVQWTPILLTPFLMAAGVGSIFSRKLSRTLLPVASILALLNGSVGMLYHVRGIWRRPGGVKMMVKDPRSGILYQLTYGPPPFAPLLFAASGFLGLLASLMRRER